MRISTEPAGDCSILATLARFEILNNAQVARPSLSTKTLITRYRSKAVKLISGESDLDGIAARIFRQSEGLPAKAAACEKAMLPWTKARFWEDDVPNRAAAFLFALVRVVGRQIIVIEADN